MLTTYAVHDIYMASKNTKLQNKIFWLAIYTLSSSAIYADIKNISWFQLNFPKGGRLIQRVTPKTHYFSLENRGRLIQNSGLYTWIYGNLSLKCEIVIKTRTYQQTKICELTEQDACLTKDECVNYAS